MAWAACFHWITAPASAFSRVRGYTRTRNPRCSKAGARMETVCGNSNKAPCGGPKPHRSQIEETEMRKNSIAISVALALSAPLAAHAAQAAGVTNAMLEGGG